MVAAESTQHGLVSHVISEDLSIQDKLLTEGLVGILGSGTSLEPSGSLSAERSVTVHLLHLGYVVSSFRAVY